MKLYNYTSPIRSTEPFHFHTFNKGENSNIDRNNIFDVCNEISGRMHDEKIVNFVLNLLFKGYMHSSYKEMGLNVIYLDNDTINYLNKLDISTIDGMEIELPKYTCSWNINNINILTQITSVNTKDALNIAVGKKRVKLLQLIKKLPHIDNCLISAIEDNDYRPLLLDKRSCLPKFDALGEHYQNYNDYRIHGRYLKNNADKYSYLSNLIFKASFVIQCCPDLLGDTEFINDNYKEQGKGIRRLIISNTQRVDHLVSEHIRYLIDKRYRRQDELGNLLPLGEDGAIRSVKVKSHVRGKSKCSQITGALI